MIKQYVSPATCSAEIATDDDGCYVIYNILGLSLEELNIPKSQQNSHDLIDDVEFFTPDEEYKIKCRISEEFVAAKVIFKAEIEADIASISKDFLYKYILFVIKNSNIKIGEPIKIQKILEVSKNRKKFVKSSNSLYTYYNTKTENEIRCIDFKDVDRAFKGIIIDDIIDLFSIENQILRFVAIYEMINRLCGDKQKATIEKITQLVQRNNYSIPLDVSWPHTSRPDTMKGDMLTYIRSKCSHAVETVAFSSGKFNILLNEFSTLEYEVKSFTGDAIKVLLDVLAEHGATSAAS